MTVLIFGAGGQVGRALVKTAPTEDVVALNHAACDVTDVIAVRRAIAAAQPEVVVNAAAYTAVDRAEEEHEQAATLNAQAPGIIAAEARKAKCAFVHLSTDFVFDGMTGAPRKPDDATNPLSVYGRTKRDGEIAVMAANAGALIVRTAWVYAPTGANFVRTMLRLMRERDLVSVVADQVGTPTYAPSLANAIWGLWWNRRRGLHHFTDAGVASWYDFAVAIQEEALALGLLTRPCAVVPIPSEDYPTPARRPGYSVLDKSETWPVLGKPTPHWRVNLRTCLHEIARNG